jgi:hypothetical protein
MPWNDDTWGIPALSLWEVTGRTMVGQTDMTPCPLGTDSLLEEIYMLVFQLSQ